MKKLFFIILFITHINLFSQTKIDTLVFNKVNDFRVSNGLNKLIWKKSLYVPSLYHSNYLKLLNEDSVMMKGEHDELRDIENFEEMTFVERIKKFNMPVRSYENVLIEFGKYTLSDEEISTLIVEGWKHSKGHRKTMLTPSIKYAACATIVMDKYFYLTKLPKKVRIKKFLSTMDFSD